MRPRGSWRRRGGVVLVDGLQHAVPADIGRPLPDLPRRLVVLNREEAGLRLADEIAGGHVAALALHAACGRTIAVVALHVVVAWRHVVLGRVVERLVVRNFLDS